MAGKKPVSPELYAAMREEWEFCGTPLATLARIGGVSVSSVGRVKAMQEWRRRDDLPSDDLRVQLRLRLEGIASTGGALALIASQSSGNDPVDGCRTAHKVGTRVPVSEDYALVASVRAMIVRRLGDRVRGLPVVGCEDLQAQFTAPYVPTLLAVWGGGGGVGLNDVGDGPYLISYMPPVSWHYTPVEHRLVPGHNSLEFTDYLPGSHLVHGLQPELVFQRLEQEAKRMEHCVQREMKEMAGLEAQRAGLGTPPGGEGGGCPVQRGGLCAMGWSGCSPAPSVYGNLVDSSDSVAASQSVLIETAQRQVEVVSSHKSMISKMLGMANDLMGKINRMLDTFVEGGDTRSNMQLLKDSSMALQAISHALGKGIPMDRVAFGIKDETSGPTSVVNNFNLNVNGLMGVPEKFRSEILDLVSRMNDYEMSESRKKSMRVLEVVK